MWKPEHILPCADPKTSASRIITLRYRKIIDQHADKLWDRQLWQHSYIEFKMQAQFYDPHRESQGFKALKDKIPDWEKINFRVSAAIFDDIKQLKGLMPDVTDFSEKPFLCFHQFQFEVLESDLNQPGMHRVAIDFISTKLLWHETIGSSLLVSDEKINDEGAYETGLLDIVPGLTIHSLFYP